MSLGHRQLRLPVHELSHSHQRSTDRETFAPPGVVPATLDLGLQVKLNYEDGCKLKNPQKGEEGRKLVNPTSGPLKFTYGGGERGLTARAFVRTRKPTLDFRFFEERRPIIIRVKAQRLTTQSAAEGPAVWMSTSGRSVHTQGDVPLN